MNVNTENFDVVVCGGGLAGFCAAVAAARHGARTILIHDRPVLGGNSSSEVCVTTHGAANFHAYARETGIMSELLIEQRARNHEITDENGWISSVWDIILYDLAQPAPNLSLRPGSPAIGKASRSLLSNAMASLCRLLPLTLRSIMTLGRFNPASRSGKLAAIYRNTTLSRQSRRQNLTANFDKTAFPLTT